ncbi:serine hydrolase domain-containing protein [Nonomuraea sp. NPDC003804]|uniref:serine hydrolase domain-containing protein n=1 Tax=Nonomuraea sp. NPDC003804 TaxID=3154547 RepID=UPI0033B29C3F
MERDLAEFLRATRTTAFIAIKDDTILFEGYFQGYRHESAVPSFSVAKPFVSALVAIALDEGLIGSLDDPVTTYLPELAVRGAAFGPITLRHLLTMSSGLAHQNPYYDLDLRVAALEETEIAEPPGRRFHYNNINTVLLGLVLERVTGGPVSAYLERKLWGPLGMEADSLWSMDGERSAVERMQAGINARAVDFAKSATHALGILAGRAADPRAWVADSTRVDTPRTCQAPCHRGRAGALGHHHLIADLGHPPPGHQEARSQQDASECRRYGRLPVRWRRPHRWRRHPSLPSTTPSVSPPQTSSSSRSQIPDSRSFSSGPPIPPAPPIGMKGEPMPFEAVAPRLTVPDPRLAPVPGTLKVVAGEWFGFVGVEWIGFVGV